MAGFDNTRKPETERSKTSLLSVDRLRGGKFVTVSGYICPITTKDIQQYLQEKMNIVVQSSQDKTPVKVWANSIGPKKPSDFKHQDHDLNTVVPILLMMDSGVKPRKNKVQETDLGNIVGGRQSQRLEIRQDVFNMLNNYRWTRNDLNALDSPKYRRSLGITQETVKVFHKYSNFSEASLYEGGPKIICVLLDPIRVIRDMLIDVENPTEPFRVKILKTVMISETKCSYEVLRDSRMRQGITDSSIEKMLRNKLENM